MMQLLISAIIILPIIVGILSVDIDGNRISVREAIKDFIMTEPIRGTVKDYVGMVEIENKTQAKGLIEIPFDETGNKLDGLTSQIADAITFLLIQSRDLGIWLGMATAPFHYLLAITIAFVFLFPDIWIYGVAFFYILIKEHKEIRQDIHDARVRAKIK